MDKTKKLSETENDVNTGTVDKNFVSSSIITHIPKSDDRNKGGRPKGTTNVTKKQVADSVTAALNEITEEYKKKKSEGPMKKGELASIIASVKRKRSLPDDVRILPDTIRRRVRRKSTFVTHRGPASPLAAIELTVVKIIIQMARIRQSLTQAKGLALVNSLINGTDLQKELIKWKSNNTTNSVGSVGSKYWKNFMTRHNNKIRSKRGKKYSLDRSNWTTWSNFDDMYRHNYHEMEIAGVAKRLDEPVWKDRQGRIVDESDAFGCKVTHELIHPEYCIVGDEVGGNLNMSGDGHVGGQKLLCATDSVPQKKVSTNDRHFTVLPLTLLTGEPLMCILVLSGKRENALTEMGINSEADVIGQELSLNFVDRNSGEGKLFPGGPTCHVNGKTIPCFVRWSEKGGITSEILRSALAELDHLNVFPRRDNLNPYLLVDGHGSRFEVQFLKYINDDEHPWNVCIGTPYGTALWQVGDSAEQNGSFNIALAKTKQDLLDKRYKKSMKADLHPHDIIPLINKAWEQSFVRVDKNKNAIADRGWNSLNRNLLTNDDICSTMTKEDKANEESGDV